MTRDEYSQWILWSMGEKHARYKRIGLRDGYKCHYCLLENDEFEIDHKYPKSKGGGNEDSNLVLACKGCNRKKRDKVSEEWGNKEYDTTKHKCDYEYETEFILKVKGHEIIK